MINEITYKVIGAAYLVHKNLGPGLLESSYKECLFYELNKLRLEVEKEKPLPLVYEEVKLEIGYRIDILVNKQVVVEIKAVEQINEVHLAQILTYLKLTKSTLGLLINFNVADLKKGIKRVINSTV
jgi:GxxExxY protein